MSIEPRPLTAERRAEIESRHVDHSGCDSADLLADILHAEQRIAELETRLARFMDATEQRIKELEGENTALREAAERIIDETDHEQQCPYCPAVWDDFTSAHHEDWCPREIMEQALLSIPRVQRATAAEELREEER